MVALGGVFLLRELGLIPENFGIGGLFATCWPVLLIIAGVGAWAGSGFKPGWWPAALVLSGVVLLLSNLCLWDWSWGSMWPVALIAVGLVLVLKTLPASP